MENKKCVINVKITVDKDLLSQKLNKIQNLKKELENELNSISEVFKIID